MSSEEDPIAVLIQAVDIAVPSGTLPVPQQLFSEGKTSGGMRVITPHSTRTLIHQILYP